MGSRSVRKACSGGIQAAMEDEAGEQESGVYDTVGRTAGDRELVSWIKNSGIGEHQNLGLH
jgi:hypothetical protein